MLWDFSKWPEYRGGHISVFIQSTSSNHTLTHVNPLPKSTPYPGQPFTHNADLGPYYFVPIISQTNTCIFSRLTSPLW